MAAPAVTTAMPPTAAVTSAAPATSASRTPSPTTAITAITTVPAISGVRRSLAVEVRLIWLIGKISAALNHQRSRWNRLGFLSRWRRFTTSGGRHLRALLLQDRLARKPDTVAFDGQHLHQHLVAFLQLIAHIGNAMLRHFTDVQQTFGSRNNLNKRSKIGQPSHFSQIGLPYLGRRGDIADNLQRFLC